MVHKLYDILISIWPNLESLKSLNLRGNIYVYSACYGSLFRWDLKYRDQILDRSPANHPIEAGAEMINISKISPPPILLINFGIKN